MKNLLDIKNLSVSFDTSAGEVEAVRDVSLSLASGEVLAIVGESGCGKSVLCKSIMKLLPRSARIKSGSVIAGGTDVTGIGEREMQKLRGRLFSMVFQDPLTSLNPIMTIGSQIAEAVRVHQPRLSRRAVHERVIELMTLVGIDRPEERSRLYPCHFSGGMRQRSVLAIALAADPKILFADEPTTALDVTIQAQILDLFRDIQKKLHTATIFVSHDLSVVAQIADRVAVMYAGKIVEIGTVREIFTDARHPYTWGLMRSLPAFAKKDEPLFTIPGMPPTLINPPKGDAFACRNTFALAIDYEEMPPMFQISKTHAAATWLLDPRAPKIDKAHIPENHIPEAAPLKPHTRELNAAYERARQSTLEGAERKSHEAAVGKGAVGKPPHDAALEDAVKNTLERSADKDTIGRLPHDASGRRIDASARQNVQILEDILLDVRHLTHHFKISKSTRLCAVNDVSFQIRRGEIFGLVGESGSGKSTVARCVMNIYRPTAGEILYDGIDLFDKAQYRAHKKYLQTSRQLIFQDSNSSLDQRMKVMDIIAEPMAIHHMRPPRGSYREEAAFQLKYVGMDASYLDKYPPQLSGGQRQRVAIARAVSMEPEFLVADEPISSLDVSIQAQIINLFKHLQQEHGFTFLFIAHDLSVVRYLCDRVGVMHQGELVEVAPTQELFEAPKHPYTKKLLAAIPKIPEPPT